MKNQMKNVVIIPVSVELAWLKILIYKLYTG